MAVVGGLVVLVEIQGRWWLLKDRSRRGDARGVLQGLAAVLHVIGT